MHNLGDLIYASQTLEDSLVSPGLQKSLGKGPRRHRRDAQWQNDYFIGRGLTKIQAAPDETEFLEVAVFPFDQVLQMVIESQIRDSMTVIAVLLAARLQNK
jgi:hypothetical protein